METEQDLGAVETVGTEEKISGTEKVGTEKSEVISESSEMKVNVDSLDTKSEAETKVNRNTKSSHDLLSTFYINMYTSDIPLFTFLTDQFCL